MKEISNHTVQQAIGGDKASLEFILKKSQSSIFNLCLRFLWNRSDAEDATQEILLKTLTHLSSFKMQSSFSTWVYRIATNYLINAKKSFHENQSTSFENFSSYIHSGLDSIDYSGADKNILAQEVKLSCSTALLLCLSREQRIAYILGEVFELESKDAAFITETNQENFRKRLSIARGKVRSFMQSHCGIVNEKNKCRCSKRIHSGLQSKRLNPPHFNFVSNQQKEKIIKEVEVLQSVSELYKSHPYYETPEHIFKTIKGLMDNGEFEVLQ